MAKRKRSTFERLMSGKLNRKQRKAFVRRLSSDDPGGCESSAVVTPDMAKMSDWLKSCGVTHVVMRFTGVYWIAVYELRSTTGSGS